MKKLILIVALLLVASTAFAQLSYVGTAYTGPNVGRVTPDSKLGMHDVMAAASAFAPNKPTDATGTVISAERNGCQSCHVPHGAIQTEYLWRYNLPANIVQKGTSITFDETTNLAAFHTLACLSCHDGVTAPDVYANLAEAVDNGSGGKTMPSYAKIGPDLSHDHPVHQNYSLHSAKSTTLVNGVGITNVKFYQSSTGTDPVADATGTYVSGTNMGYVECGTCHDPHKGDGATYMFLRSAKGVAATPQYARLDLCRSCHGK